MPAPPPPAPSGRAGPRRGIIGRSLGRLGIDRTRWRRAAGAVLAVAIGLMATVAVAGWGRAEQSRENEAALAEDGRQVIDSALLIADGLEARVRAVASLFRASDEVTEAEFAQFVDDLGVLEGTGGYAFAVIDSGGGMSAEVVYTAPGDAFGVPPIGTDLMSEPTRAEAVLRALDTRAPAVSGFVELPGEEDPDGFLVLMPVVRGDSVQGVVVAVSDLSSLVEATFTGPLAERLLWQVSGLDDGVALGSLDGAGEPGWSRRLFFGDRVWEIEIAHRPEFVGSSLLSQYWVTVPAGVAASLLAGTLVLVSAAALDSRRRRARYEAVIESKDRFLATVSHEMRTPLTGVIGFLDRALTAGDMTEAERWEMAGVAAEQAREMAAILEDLITATRDDPSAVTVATTRVHLPTQVAGVLLAFPHRVELHMDDDRDGLCVWGDPKRIRQVIRNLLTNAVRYGEPPIELEVRHGPETTTLRVVDHGTGVPEHQSQQLFRPHNPLNQPSSQPESLGIGLWISRQLAQLMGGDLSYEAEPLPTFTLSLRTAAPAVLPDPEVAAAR